MRRKLNDLKINGQEISVSDLMAQDINKITDLENAPYAGNANYFYFTGACELDPKKQPRFTAAEFKANLNKFKQHDFGATGPEIESINKRMLKSDLKNDRLSGDIVGHYWSDIEKYDPFGGMVIVWRVYDGTYHSVQIWDFASYMVSAGSLEKYKVLAKKSSGASKDSSKKTASSVKKAVGDINDILKDLDENADNINIRSKRSILPAYLLQHITHTADASMSVAPNEKQSYNKLQKLAENDEQAPHDRMGDLIEELLYNNLAAAEGAREANDDSKPSAILGLRAQQEKLWSVPEGNQGVIIEYKESGSDTKGQIEIQNNYPYHTDKSGLGYKEQKAYGGLPGNTVRNTISVTSAEEAGRSMFQDLEKMDPGVIKEAIFNSNFNASHGMSGCIEGIYRDAVVMYQNNLTNPKELRGKKYTVTPDWENYKNGLLAFCPYVERFDKYKIVRPKDPTVSDALLNNAINGTIQNAIFQRDDNGQIQLTLSEKLENELRRAYSILTECVKAFNKRRTFLLSAISTITARLVREGFMRIDGIIDEETVAGDLAVNYAWNNAAAKDDESIIDELMKYIDDASKDPEYFTKIYREKLKNIT